MAMKYKTKCICQIDPEYFTRVQRSTTCVWCHGSGKVEYDFNVDFSRTDNTSSTKFWSDDPDGITDAKIEYEDFSTKIVCNCGDEIFLGSDGDAKVCSCGRVYCLWVEVLKDDTHRGDMEFWEKEKIKKGKSE